MYAKIAIGNIKRSFGDYSIYFMTLAFAACLLYSFTASTDYLLALDLSEQQRGVYDSANGVMQAFSVFSVIVFAFLIVYANRFILRRRSREFALYEILGMPASSIARILAYEGCVVGFLALVIGMVVAVVISPLSGFVAAFVFDVPYKLVFTFSSDALCWTAGCFLAIMALATLLGIRDVGRRPLIELLRANSTPDSPKGLRRLPTAVQLAFAFVVLAVVWGSCILQPVFFVVWILPLGILAVLATAVLFRFFATTWPSRAGASHPLSLGSALLRHPPSREPRLVELKRHGLHLRLDCRCHVHDGSRLGLQRGNAGAYGRRQRCGVGTHRLRRDLLRRHLSRGCCCSARIAAARPTRSIAPGALRCSPISVATPR